MPLARVKYEDVERKAGVPVSVTLFGSDPATAANYDVIFTAPRPMEILWWSATWRVASTSGTLNLEILNPGEALDAGAEVSAADVSTAGTANTPVAQEGTDLSANRVMKAGDRLALKDGGTLTNLAGLSVTVYLKYANRGDFY